VRRTGGEKPPPPTVAPPPWEGVTVRLSHGAVGWLAVGWLPAGWRDPSRGREVGFVFARLRSLIGPKISALLSRKGGEEKENRPDSCYG